MKRVRQSNFEMMRIISMFFIVIYHMLVSTGGQLILHTTGYTKIFFELLSLIIIVHVNSFILVSGYFQYDKEVKIKKVISLIGMAWIYGIIIAFISSILGLHDFDLLDSIKVLSPLEFQNLWFLKTYIALYLLSPYLNILIRSLNQRKHRTLIITLFIMFSLISTVTNQNTFNNNGFSLIHFVFLYIVGSYLKKYPVSKNVHFKGYSSKKKFIIFLTVFLFLGVFNFLLYEFSINVLKNNTSKFVSYVCHAINDNIYFYQNPILIVQSISYFLIFETLNIKNKIINIVSSSVFAVYIITENPFVLGEIYKFLGIYTGDVIYGSNIIIRMFICSLIVLFMCIIIELFRKFILVRLKKIRLKNVS